MTRSAQDLDLGILLGLGYQHFVHEMREALAEKGFGDAGPSYGYVFRSLDLRAMNISELADRLTITKQGAAQLVDEMEKRGYVERRPDPGDRRAKLLYLSDKGNNALAAARRFHRDLERKLVKAHGAEAVRTLRTLLEAITTPENLADPRWRAPHI
ncbi:MarR family winged helix-turn-helix transcriptional regulator [Nocardia sp. XZ_19_385]|uniref:MarR family winged helix-turn-helix transcriptional regulator n=1 Tax=Nocardia sp. XZ_19_385 TaxID=2769488 RepID=UPI001E53710B|nr:MarR family winged helix-turn-helix transcriptional regulator [Nocardia sp. XZ_19_385]